MKLEIKQGEDARSVNITLNGVPFACRSFEYKIDVETRRPCIKIEGIIESTDIHVDVGKNDIDVKGIIFSTKDPEEFLRSLEFKNGE